jgi:hypothetical protein
MVKILIVYATEKSEFLKKKKRLKTTGAFSLFYLELSA